MVVGTQKSATTWLFECLHEHPEICVPEMKEVHFFCPESCRFSRADKGADWYEGLFPEANYKAWGELTTDYMYYPEVCAQLHAFNPNMQIIFLLRDPVDRAYSAYWMWRRHSPDLPEFDELIHSDLVLAGRGLYHRQIVPYIEKFGREKVKIYIYEEVTKNKDAFLADLYEFVGANPDFRPLTKDRSVGATRQYPGIFGFLLYKIISPIINLPGIISLWRFIRRRTTTWEKILSTLSKGSERRGYPPLPDKDRQAVATLFRDENAKLFKLLEREIIEWTP